MMTYKRLKKVPLSSHFWKTIKSIFLLAINSNFDQFSIFLVEDLNPEGYGFYGLVIV